MELKQLNKIIILLTFTISMNSFSQMKMIDINGEKLTINLEKEKRNVIKISENKDYCVFYILDKRGLDFDVGLGTVDLVNLIFFSKKYNKGILTIFEQGIVHKKKSVYDITLYTNHFGKYMYKSSMAILDKDFNYEYLMKYSYIHLPHDRNVYTSSISIQDINNYCNVMHTKIEGNVIYENIDDILSNISKVPNTSSTSKKCDPIVYDIDRRDYFPKEIKK